MASVLNETFYPVLLVALDEPFVPGEVDEHIQRLAALASRSLAAGRRHVVIVVGKQSISAAGRNAVSDAVKKHFSPEQNDATYATFVVMASALQRGVLTVFRWVAPETVKSVQAVSSMEEAFDHAMRALDRLGTPFTGNRAGLRRALGLSDAQLSPI